MEDKPEAAIDAWQERDRQFEQQFGKSRVFNKCPSMNQYRDHLLAGVAVGALPVEGGHLSAEELATQDYDAIIAQRPIGLISLQTTVARSGITKILLDLQAGKIPIVVWEETDKQAA